jgi:DNA-binding MarR family transcriptional regulator
MALRAKGVTGEYTIGQLAVDLGIRRKAAGQALRELQKSGYCEYRELRKNGLFGGITYTLTLPSDVTEADRKKVADKLTKLDSAAVDYRWRIADKLLDEIDIAESEKAVLDDRRSEQAGVDWGSAPGAS